MSNFVRGAIQILLRDCVIVIEGVAQWPLETPLGTGQWQWQWWSGLSARQSCRQPANQSACPSFSRKVVDKRTAHCSGVWSTIAWLRHSRWSEEIWHFL